MKKHYGWESEYRRKKFLEKHNSKNDKSQYNEKSISKNNFMSISTTTKEFDGVIEVFDLYINSIKNLSSLKIMETQRNMITHLSSTDLIDKIRNRDYAFLERYFKEGFADESDYNDTLLWLTFTNNNINPSKEELIHLKEIFSLISKYFEKTNKSENVEKVLQLQRKLEKNNNYFKICELLKKHVIIGLEIDSNINCLCEEL